MVHEGERETVEINASGTIHDQEDKTKVYFENEGHLFEIIFDQNTLKLKQNESVLHFALDEDIDNDYQTPYGTLSLQTSLERLTIKEDVVHIKYHLKQNDVLVSTVYMQLFWMPL